MVVWPSRSHVKAFAQRLLALRDASQVTRALAEFSQVRTVRTLQSMRA